MKCDSFVGTGSKVKVSVIIPVYNCEKYLKQAIDSVLLQKVETSRIEIILVDDGSTDETRAIALSYGDRINYVRISHCGYPGAVRNVGIERAEGDFIAFLDADDCLLPGSVAFRVEALKKEPEVGFVYGNYCFCDGVKQWVQFQELMPSGSIFDRLFDRNVINMNTVLVRRRLLQESGGFLPTIRTSEDYGLWLQLTAKTRSTYVPFPLAITRVRPESVSRLPLLEKLPNLIHVLAIVAKQFGVPNETVNQRLSPLRVWLAKEQWHSGQWKRAVTCLFGALVADPKRMVVAVCLSAAGRLADRLFRDGICQVKSVRKLFSYRSRLS